MGIGHRPQPRVTARALILVVVCVGAGLLARQADAQGEELIVPNFSGSSITVYSRTASGDAAPVRTVVGPATGLSTPLRAAVDSVHGEVAVTNSSRILVFAQTASGNTPPLRTIDGPATGLVAPRGVLIDIVHDEIIVADPPANAVRVFARTAAGDVVPLRTLAGALTGLNGA